MKITGQALPDLHFFALADGMGGHRAGEVASHEAVTALCDIVKTALGDAPRSDDP